MDKLDSLLYAVLLAVICTVVRSLILGHFRSKNKK